MRLKLYFSFIGTRYCGWQKQSHNSQSIQEVFEQNLSRIAGRPVSIIASGRTDAGVHARIQVAHADFPDTHARMLEIHQGMTRLQASLNHMLPKAIRVWRVEPAAADFHAIRDVLKKTYVYFIDPSPIQCPELRHHAWHLRFPLDWQAIQEATRYFKGEHDFRAFCASDSFAKTTVRCVEGVKVGDVEWCGLTQRVSLKAIRVTGKGFLKQMVRSMVGTLVKIGSHKAKPTLVLEALQSGNRQLTGVTAPPQGLWLWDILYR